MVTELCPPGKCDPLKFKLTLHSSNAYRVIAGLKASNNIYTIIHI